MLVPTDEEREVSHSQVDRHLTQSVGTPSTYVWHAPDLAVAYERLSQLSVRRKDYDVAVAAMRDSVDLWEELAKGLPRRGSLSRQSDQAVHVNLTGCLVAAGDLTAAEDQARTSLALAKKRIEVEGETPAAKAGLAQDARFPWLCVTGGRPAETCPRSAAGIHRTIWTMQTDRLAAVYAKLVRISSNWRTMRPLWLTPISMLRWTQTVRRHTSI